MTRRLLTLVGGLALTVVSRLPAAESVSASVAEPVIMLPPMIVAETGTPILWRYQRVGNDEYLSVYPSPITNPFIESRSRQFYRLRAIVPDAFLADLPSVTILYDEALRPKASDVVGNEIFGREKSVAAVKGRTRVEFLPNLGLRGRDVAALFVYLDAKGFTNRELAIASSYLRLRLERRTPSLPAWLVEGILAVHADLEPPPNVEGPMVARDVFLRRLTWLSDAESRALVTNPQRPRALLPVNELFAIDALAGEGDHHPQRVATWRTQVGLFVRWGLDPRNRAQAAFWEFARRASEERLTEEMFSQCFGFGFADLRDRLYDYLPVAVKNRLKLDPGEEPGFALGLVSLASPAQVARLRGEWERLEIVHVLQHHPGLVERYAAQARTTLSDAYARGERDAQFLATFGLCEVDAGNAAAAMPFLDAALAAGVNRPSVCYEVARFRFAEVTRDQPATRLYLEPELAAVFAPLRRALSQSPQLPEVYGLLADACVRLREAPSAADLAALQRGATYFASNGAVSSRLAIALARFGRRAEAIELLERAGESVADEAMRGRLSQLRATLTGGAPAR